MFPSTVFRDSLSRVGDVSYTPCEVRGIELLKLFLVFFKIGVIGFGGGYGMLPLIEHEMVDGGYLTRREFWDIVAIAESTPGPIAVNVATFVGYRIAGIMGSAISTTGVVLPAFLVILAIAAGLRRVLESQQARWILIGMKSAIVGFLAMATFSLFKVISAQKVLVFAIAVVSFTALYMGANPFVVILVFAGVGYILGLLGKI